MTSDEDLIGYALNLLEPDERAAVEAELIRQPALAQKLSRLRQALQPLEIVREHPPTPPGLVTATLVRVAQHTLEHGRPVAVPRRPEPIFPVDTPPPVWPSSVRGSDPDLPNTGWRPLELLVAASIALLAVGLGASGLFKLRHEQQLLACQNQMRQLHTALNGYAAVHQGHLPQVGTMQIPTASDVAPELQRLGHLPTDFAPHCPNGSRQSAYAYTLGYKTARGTVRGLTTYAADWTPILADLPSTVLDRVAHTQGQNILFVNGAVRFTTVTQFGLDEDDIYLNAAQLRRAGLHANDICLGTPGAIP